MAVSSGMGWAGIVSIPIPDDGATGEVLTKQSNADYDTDWDAGGGGAVPDGNYGDVIVSVGGTVWTISNDSVTNAKLADMPALTIKGNNTGAPVNPLDLTVAEVKTLLGLPSLGLVVATVYGTLMR